jgi:hypothetical protein
LEVREKFSIFAPKNGFMMAERRYPIGIQTFSEIIRGGYVYVDKTDLIWQLAHYAKFIFMSRPRRFGKSLLTSTMESYFRGDKELFEGLKIMQLEKEWEQYPVLHIDLSVVKGQQDAKELRSRLMLLLDQFSDKYGADSQEFSPGSKLDGLVRRAYRQTGKQVVVIIDEYDGPLLDVIHDEALLDDARKVMQEFYQPLKANERYIKFCFLTGITRLSQLNIFSTLNNLTNVTLQPEFSAICGITHEELCTQLSEDIRLLAKSYDYTEEEMTAKLKMRYDGYHFSGKSPDIYNPYSLLSAFANKRVANYWFETGTPTFLIRLMKQFKFNITEMDDIEATDYSINRPTEAMTTMIPLLYQTGYLTIKDFDRESEIYTLSIPNQEVRIGYSDGLLPGYAGLEGEDVQAGFALKFWRALKKGDVDLAIREMQAYLAGIPYVEGFKQKLADAATAEGFYEYTMYLIFSMLNVYVRTQVKCAGGRIDMVVWMPDTTYVFELKTEGTAQEALAQIDDRGYAIQYQTEGRRVVKIGVKFNKETRIPENWVIS